MNTIEGIEIPLTKLNSKSCQINKYKKYVASRLEIYEITKIYYRERRLRKNRMTAYITKQRSEMKITNQILDKYQEDKNEVVNIMIGDWSPSEQMKNFISTPNVGLYKNIMKRGNIKFYKVHEAYTSKIDHKSHQILENKKVEINGKIVTLHSVLVRKYVTETGREREEYLNRDYGGVNGIKKVAKRYLTDRGRPEEYTKQHYDKERVSSEEKMANIAKKIEMVENQK